LATTKTLVGSRPITDNRFDHQADKQPVNWSSQSIRQHNQHATSSSVQFATRGGGTPYEIRCVRMLPIRCQQAPRLPATEPHVGVRPTRRRVHRAPHDTNAKSASVKMLHNVSMIATNSIANCRPSYSPTVPAELASKRRVKTIIEKPMSMVIFRKTHYSVASRVFYGVVTVVGISSGNELR
jgi:hypothetical protein